MKNPELPQVQEKVHDVACTVARNGASARSSARRRDSAKTKGSAVGSAEKKG